LESIIWQCTQPNPQDRFQNCDELMFALEHYRELDIEYKKKQKKKLGIFATCFAASVLSLILALVSDSMYRETLTSNYEFFIQSAGSEIQKEDAIEQYMNAIQIAPKRGEAYEKLLTEVILDDDVLTQEEAYVIRDILNDKNVRDQTNEMYFMENTEEFDRFAYQLGIAYFYSYEDKGNKTLSKKWLEIASNSENLTQSETERAKCLGKIADYYSKIGIQSKSGDASVSYLDYWNDLKQLTQGNLVEKDNETTALIMYKELAYQIYTNCISFKKEGVSEEEMEQQLDLIRQKLTTDFDVSEQQGNERVKGLYDELEEYLQLAKDALEATFADNNSEEQ